MHEATIMLSSILVSKVWCFFILWLFQKPLLGLPDESTVCYEQETTWMNFLVDELLEGFDHQMDPLIYSLVQTSFICWEPMRVWFGSQLSQPPGSLCQSITKTKHVSILNHPLALKPPKIALPVTSTTAWNHPQSLTSCNWSSTNAIETYQTSVNRVRSQDCKPPKWVGLVVFLCTVYFMRNVHSIEEHACFHGELGSVFTDEITWFKRILWTILSKEDNRGIAIYIVKGMLWLFWIFFFTFSFFEMTVQLSKTECTTFHVTNVYFIHKQCFLILVGLSKGPFRIVNVKKIVFGYWMAS